MAYRGYDELRRGLVLHLPFSEGVGTSVKDTSQYRNNGTLLKSNGVLPQWVEGREGRRAIEFDGVGAYGSVPDAPELRPGDDSITIIASVKLDRSDHMYIWNKMGALGCAFRADSSGRLRFIYHDGATTYYPLSDANIYSADIWQRIGVILDRTNDKIRFYVEGVFKTEVDFDPVVTLSFAGGATIFSSAWFGKHSSGFLDELRFYNRALDAIEMRNVSNLRGLI